MGSLSGRTFVITGAGRGLGAAFAMVFGAEGAGLVLTGRDTQALERVRDAVVAQGGSRPEIARLDLSDTAGAAAVARDIAGRVPAVDGLINNGATWQTGRITDHDSAALAAVVASQVSGALVVTRELAPAMLAAPAADIVTVISNSGLPNVPRYGATAAFHAAKHGQAGMTEGLRQEFAGTNVRVIGLYPPDLDTMTPLDAAWAESPARGHDSRVTSRDVVEAALFAVTRPRNCTLATIVLDSDTGGLYPSATPRHGDKAPA
jgi:NAD(P)-dependent dehydrogenase (short-subunit alcohol dehydrogenase family)